MTFDHAPFLFGPALLHWVLVFGSFAGIVFSVSVLIALGVYGAPGPTAVMGRVWQGLHDFLGISPRRIWALSLLTIKEAVRRKALFVFVVFASLVMFAGWFLESDLRADLQVKNAVGFALTTISWLTLPVVLLLSCWGLPEDIRLRSIHTIVTKPVRRNEIVMGRILGFSIVAGLIVSLMGTVGYVWIRRQVPNNAELICRVPIYGELSFLDREGNLTDKGVNTGDIWEFRSYVEGGTRSSAIYKFPMDQVADKVRFESRFEAFRTHKGKIGQSLLVRYVLVNPTKGLRVPLESFEVVEFGLNEKTLERQIWFFDEDKNDNRTVDLFDDVVDQNQLTVEVQCLDAGQYLGMSRPDMFIRMPDRSFMAGYFKAVVGVLLLSIFLISIGVTSSTFVKGPVSILLTFTVLIVGQGFREFMLKLITGEQKGGGPIESWYRLITHMNDTLQLPDNFGVKLMQSIDNLFMGGLWLVQHLIPDLSYFVMSPYVANGFDVPWSTAMAKCVAMTVGYLVPCLLVGYYSLTLRELEAK